MPLIQTQSAETATGDVAEIYRQMQQAWGNVPNGFALFSANPLWLKQQWEYVGYYMQHPTLSFSLQAVVRMLVSVGQKCDYCIDMNTGMLMGMAGWTAEQVAATRADVSDAPFSEREKALLRLVLKAVREPLAVTALDLDDLRMQGWNDQEILDAVNHGARQVASDIVFNTFKVERDL